MRRAARAGVLLCGLVTLIAGCDGDSPTSTTDQWPAQTPGVSLATASASCTPPTHPGGIVDKVDAPAPWGVAVRDDGLTFFTGPVDDECPEPDGFFFDVVVGTPALATSAPVP